MKEKNTMINTHNRIVVGMVAKGNVIERKDVSIRITSNEQGEILSLGSVDDYILIAVRYQEVIDLIKEARKDRKLN